MSQEMVQKVVSLLRDGGTPLVRLHVRRGNDFLLMRVVGTDSRRFQCVAADPKRNDTFFLSHDSIKHGTFILQVLPENEA